MNKKKILFVTSTFCRKPGEMQDPWMLESIQHLQQRGFTIDVLAPSFRGLSDHILNGITVHRWRYFFKRWEDLTHDQGASNKIRGNILYKVMFFPYICFGFIKAFRVARRNSYDIIHCHWPFPQALIGMGAMLGAKGKKPKLLLHFYGASLLLAKKFKFIRPVLSWSIKRADGIISISSFTGAQVNEIRQAEMSIIPFGSPLSQEPLPLPQNQTREILTVGRIVERKGIQYLIQALPAVLQTFDVKLYVVGSGDPRIEKELRDLSNKLNLIDKVVFTGKIDDESLIERYKNCDLFCLPAIIDSQEETEGLGVVLLEAMNYCRPVIGSNVGGIPDIIKDGLSGLLVQQKSPEDLAEKIIIIFSNRTQAEKLAKQGHRYAIEQFSWKSIIDRWEDVYNGF